MGGVLRRGGRLLPEAAVVPLEDVAPRLDRRHRVVLVALAVVLAPHLDLTG